MTGYQSLRCHRALAVSGLEKPGRCLLSKCFHFFSLSVMGVTAITRRRRESACILEKSKIVLNRYVEYESKLEELRRLRKEKLRVEGKASIADRALVRRIHFIFERATRKFPGDLRLWLAWLEFCQAHNSRRIFFRVPSPSPRLLSCSPDLHDLRSHPFSRSRSQYGCLPPPFGSSTITTMCLGRNQMSKKRWSLGG